MMLRFLAIFLLLITFCCGGCGGGSGGSNPTPTPTPTPTLAPAIQTSVVYAIQWGSRSRTLAAPASALSLKLTLRGARPDGSDLNVIQNRGADPTAYTQNVTTLEKVNVGTWQAVVTCYAQPDGVGSVVGLGQATVTIAADGTGIGDIGIGGTVAVVIVAGGQSVPVGTQADLGFQCRDASDRLILVSPGSASFTVTAGANHLGIVNGKAEGLLPGTATVRATVDGITSAPVTVNVASNASVSVTPPNATVTVNGTLNFTAQVANSPDQTVTWSLQEGAAGGNISTGGLYSAPANPGTFHVVATSVYDPSRQATATVTVQAAGPQTVYQTEFDGPVGSEWSHTNVDTTPLGGRRFLGQFNKEAVTLSLTNLPAHGSITISFKLFIIRSMDGNTVVNIAGNEVGPDIWSVSLSGSTLLRTTFSNWEDGASPDIVPQSYPNAFGAGSFPARTGASEINTLGFIFVGVRDSVYDLTFTVPHSASTASFVFSGQEITTEGDPAEAVNEESWGIDSVVVKVNP